MDVVKDLPFKNKVGLLSNDLTKQLPDERESSDNCR